MNFSARIIAMLLSAALGCGSLSACGGETPSKPSGGGLSAIDSAKGVFPPGWRVASDGATVTQQLVDTRRQFPGVAVRPARCSEVIQAMPSDTLGDQFREIVGASSDGQVLTAIVYEKHDNASPAPLLNDCGHVTFERAGSINGIGVPVEGPDINGVAVSSIRMDATVKIGDNSQDGVVYLYDGWVDQKYRIVVFATSDPGVVSPVEPDAHLAQKLFSAVADAIKKG